MMGFAALYPSYNPSYELQPDSVDSRSLFIVLLIYVCQITRHVGWVEAEAETHQNQTKACTTAKTKYPKNHNNYEAGLVYVDGFLMGFAALYPSYKPILRVIRI